MRYIIQPENPKTDTLYLRMRPDVKKLVIEQAKKEGYRTITDWFESMVLRNFKGTKKKTVK